MSARAAWLALALVGCSSAAEPTPALVAVECGPDATGGEGSAATGIGGAGGEGGAGGTGGMGPASASGSGSIGGAGGDSPYSATSAGGSTTTATTAATTAAATTGGEPPPPPPPMCADGWADCNGDSLCETHIESNVNACGACGFACVGSADATEPTCAAGVCSFGCDTAKKRSASNAVASCDATTGAWVYTCLAPYIRCGDNPGLGCNYYAVNDDHCGACGLTFGDPGLDCAGNGQQCQAVCTDGCVYSCW